MDAIYFHDLPVYRLPSDGYVHEIEKRIAKGKATSGGAGHALIAARLDRLLRQHYLERYGPWQFNEIVGYVRLHFAGRRLRGDYFCNRASRQVLGRRKVFLGRTEGPAPELAIPPKASSAEILSVILCYVEGCRKQEPRRFFDDGWLRTVGPSVDWIGLMHAAQSAIAEA